MALPILKITRLLAQLTVLAPAAAEGIDKIRKLVETARGNDPDAVRQIDALKEAVELQSVVNRKVDEQLRLVQSVLENVQRSLRICAYALTGTGVAAVAALVIGLSIILRG